MLNTDKQVSLYEAAGAIQNSDPANLREQAQRIGFEAICNQMGCSTKDLSSRLLKSGSPTKLLPEVQDAVEKLGSTRTDNLAYWGRAACLSLLKNLS